MEADYILLLGRNTGLSVLDILLLCLCPICGAVGILVSDALRRVAHEPRFVPADRLPVHREGRVLSDLSTEERLKEYNDELRHSFNDVVEEYKKTRRRNLAFIGMVLGFVISLYFVGAITSNVTSLARVLALSVLLGYQAPNIWAAQEKILSRLVEEQLRKVLGERGMESTNPRGPAAG